MVGIRFMSFRFLFALAALQLVGETHPALHGAELLRREGQHIRLISDSLSEMEADTIVATFDAAVEQWSDFWGFAEDESKGLTVNAHVIRDMDRFRREGLIPSQVPDFPFGYALDNYVWVRVQPSPYYTRHLVLHEGVHSFAFTFFGGAGSTWFQEGTAELLATHRGVGKDVQINVVPKTREEVPYWGRFKRMKQSRQEQTVPTLATVLDYQPNLRGDVETYGWSWAASMMMSRYPEYRPLMMKAARDGQLPDAAFNRRLKQTLSNQWPIVEARWRVMCHDLDYGFDWSKEVFDLSVRDPLWDGRPIQRKIASNRGWQSLGVRVPGSVSVRLTAQGRISLAEKPKPWISEPSGITFQYHRGRPLGQLLVAVLPNAVDESETVVEPLEVHAINKETTIRIDEFSWLLFRINDAVDQMEDNQGHYDVTIRVGS